MRSSIDAAVRVRRPARSTQPGKRLPVPRYLGAVIAI